MTDYATQPKINMELAVRFRYRASRFHSSVSGAAKLHYDQLSPSKPHFQRVELLSKSPLGLFDIADRTDPQANPVP
jgi:hypothetical protein